MPIDDGRLLAVDDVDTVFRRRVEGTVGDGGVRFARGEAIALEQVVRHTLLHVVCFACEQQQRVVLSFSAKTGDRAVVAV